MFLAETWLSTDNCHGLIEACPPNYIFQHSVRQKRQGGGVVIIYPDFLICKKIDLGEAAFFEYIALDVKAELRILLVTLYRPSAHNPLFILEFSEIVSSAVIKYDRIIINGDFNFHINNKHDLKALEFLNLIEDLRMTQFVNGSTHNYGNTLDLVIVKGVDIRNVAVSDLTI